jgi:prepilin peptidase CpaA
MLRENRGEIMYLTTYLFLMIQLIFVTYGDIKFKKIPNYWSLINLITFVVLAFLFPDIYELKLQTFFYSIVFISVGYALYILKIMGGGDTKFLATSYLVIPAKFQDQTFYLLAIVTTIIGAILFIHNTYRNWKVISDAIMIKDIKTFKNIYGRKFPFAPVILCSWIIYGLQEKVWRNL